MKWPSRRPSFVSSATPATVARSPPRAVVVGDRRIEVDAVLDRWLAPDHRGFKVRGSDGNVYIIRHDVSSGAWQVTPFESGL